ncbi:MAG: RHS repeat protein, partial [Phycisphaerae bacterium]|nr:RHS repeat protein [Phycisphaerae bacterium]
AQGRLTRVYDSGGKYIELVRDTNGRLTQVKSAVETGGGGSEHLTFNYDANGRLQTLVGPDSRTWTFAYDASDRLSTLTYPADGGVTPTLAFTYNAFNRITVITDQAGSAWDTGYSNGRVVSALDPVDGGTRAGQGLQYIDTASNGLFDTNYTDRDAAVWTYKFESAGLLREKGIQGQTAQVTLTYDADYNYTSYVDPAGGGMYFQYGAAGTLTGAQLPLTGTEIVGDYGDTILTWERPDAVNKPNFWRIVNALDADGTESQFLYEEAGDPAEMTSHIVAEPDSDPVSYPNADSVLSELPRGSGWRMYWCHPVLGLYPLEREEAAIEAGEYVAAPPEPEAYIPGVYAWHRWRLLGPISHLGISYFTGQTDNKGNAVFHYVDYGAPASWPHCHSNRRYALTQKVGIDEPHFDAAHPGLFECFESSSRNYFGNCCQYNLLGWGNPNSNGAINAFRSVDKGCNIVNAPAHLRRWAPGWTNTNATFNNGSCSGY